MGPHRRPRRRRSSNAGSSRPLARTSVETIPLAATKRWGGGPPTVVKPLASFLRGLPAERRLHPRALPVPRLPLRGPGRMRRVPRPAIASPCRSLAPDAHGSRRAARRRLLRILVALPAAGARPRSDRRRAGHHRHVPRSGGDLSGGDATGVGAAPVYLIALGFGAQIESTERSPKHEFHAQSGTTACPACSRSCAPSTVAGRAHHRRSVRGASQWTLHTAAAGDTGLSQLTWGVVRSGRSVRAHVGRYDGRLTHDTSFGEAVAA